MKMYELYEGDVIPFCHCVVCGVELRMSDAHDYVCDTCMVDVREGLYDRLKENPNVHSKIVVQDY